MPENTRVAYLISHYPSLSHTFILREILALRSVGFDIQVIAIHGDDRPLEQITVAERKERERTFRVLPFGRHFLTAHVLTALRSPGKYLAGLRLACKLGGFNIRRGIYHLIYFAEAVVAGHIARKGGYRHVHTHFSSTVALIAKRIFDLDLSITIHGSDEFKDVIAFKMKEKVAGAKFVCAISYYGRGQIMLASDPADWQKIEICRLGVDPSIFTPEPHAEATGQIRIICVGRLVVVKAHRLLMVACAQLLAAGWSLRLHLVGDGPERIPLEEFAASTGITEHVVFEGSRNQDEVIAMYRQSDIFVLASFLEGVPVVLMEAMAMEIPCVATWVTGIPELIRNNEEGLLVAPSDVEGLAKAIEMLLEKPELRRRLGAAGRQKVLQDYNLNINTASLSQVFKKHVAGGSAQTTVR